MDLGILALQGGVVEHINATKAAAKHLGFACSVLEVRTARDLDALDGLILPGGESTVLQKLCEREGLFDKIKTIPNIFGTCAGAILLAKKIQHAESGQRTLELMDIEIDRNGYGRQIDSFEGKIDTKFGTVAAVFIRAPRIKSLGAGVSKLAEKGGEVLACEQRTADGRFYLATCFHPELTTTLFHEHFLAHVKSSKYSRRSKNCGVNSKPPK